MRVGEDMDRVEEEGGGCKGGMGGRAGGRDLSLVEASQYGELALAWAVCNSEDSSAALFVIQKTPVPQYIAISSQDWLADL
ncbi:hypothetical protein F0562_010748 [Nyssa sinensis]|uniref:Uncharacterized protein n=1 Tax=Nyssa sinensis TaxID=561372 RepID=A0A5J4ZZS3_9ASTE|nr:hypothetical protein F0562_010748 [Nyssa sinensis]